MTIAEAAAAALKAQTDAERAERLVDAARVTVARVLEPLDPAALRVLDADPEELLVVFTDGATHLAVTRDDTVALVDPDDDAPPGGRSWTSVATVASLAELGAALAARDGGAR